MRTNVYTPAPKSYTHEGAPAAKISLKQQLRRSVLSCMLWEDSFYESGVAIADRISQLAAAVSPHELASLAVEARQSFHLRHVPLLLLTVLAKTGRGIPLLTSSAVEQVISRPDEMAELLSIYWKDGKKPVPHGLLKGLRKAALKFDAYQLNKWDRDGNIKLRDVMFLAHIAYPDQYRARLAANIVNRTFFPEATKGGFKVKSSLGLDGQPYVAMPETHEALIAAAGSNKGARKDIWEDMLKRSLQREKGGLPYMALLRNLRSMTQDGVSPDLIEAAIIARVGAKRVLPFRFVQASRVTPQYARALDTALKACLTELEPLEGTTAICVDCSGSMGGNLSKESQVTYFDAAAALAGCVPGRTRVVAFATTAREITPLQGLGCRQALLASSISGGTNAHLAIDIVNKMTPTPDRVIMITDEQVTQSLPAPKPKHAYVINVASYKNGIGYGRYTHIDGFSPNTLDFVREFERDRSNSKELH